MRFLVSTTIAGALLGLVLAGTSVAPAAVGALLNDPEPGARNGTLTFLLLSLAIGGVFGVFSGFLVGALSLGTYLVVARFVAAPIPTVLGTVVASASAAAATFIVVRLIDITMTPTWYVLVGFAAAGGVAFVGLRAWTKAHA